MKSVPPWLNMRITLSAVIGSLLAIGIFTAADVNDSPQPDYCLSVQSFGATGTGLTDDTAAIQFAVDNVGGDVVFPSGVYRITRPIVVDLDRVGFTALAGQGTAEIVMTGPGPAFRLVGTHEGTAAPHSVKPNVWKNQRMPTIVGLGITGEHEEACGIEASGTMELIISRVHVRNVRHAIHLVKRNRNVIVSDCHLYENRGVGLYLDNLNLHQINVSGSHISYNAGGGVVSRGGNVRNLHITGCDIEGNMTADAPPTANVLIDCTGGDAGTAEVAIVGCTIQHTYLGPDSANVRFIGSDAQDRRWGHVTIGNNVFSDAQINVDVAQARGVTITGNTFWQGHQYNLRVTESSNLVVGPNNLDRNPNYVWSKSDEARRARSVLFEDCQDATITGLHINGVQGAPAGLHLKNCQRFNLSSFTILDCETAGLLLENVSHSRVSICLISNDLPGQEDFEPVVIRGENTGLNTDFDTE